MSLRARLTFPCRRKLNPLLDLQEQHQLTYMIITHDLNVIRYISDQVAVMYLGQLVEYGETKSCVPIQAIHNSKALMAASPILDPTMRGREKEIMKGDPGSLIHLPSGCSFQSALPVCSRNLHAGEAGNGTK